MEAFKIAVEVGGPDGVVYMPMERKCAVEDNIHTLDLREAGLLGCYRFCADEGKHGFIAV